MTRPMQYFAMVIVTQGEDDSTTRTPWHASAEVSVPGDAPAILATGRGTGKKPRVAAKAAIENAFGRIRGAG